MQGLHDVLWSIFLKYCPWCLHHLNLILEEGNSILPLKMTGKRRFTWLKLCKTMCNPFIFRNTLWTKDLSIMSYILRNLSRPQQANKFLDGMHSTDFTAPVGPLYLCTKWPGHQDMYVRVFSVKKCQLTSSQPDFPLKSSRPKCPCELPTITCLKKYQS